ncbi:MAG TPA: hypothetical protein DCZ03_14495 [Gammaproteobacteria bacterium]|nr:hypothetical protein [Gammaproteobacteria bacterium]
MAHINLIGVLIAALVSFALGALWYSPLLFQNYWKQAAEIDVEKQLQNPLVVYSLTALLTLFSALALNILLGPNPHWRDALGTALLLGGGIVAPSMAVNYLFVQNHSMHWAIDAGFHLVRLSLMAMVFVYWPH